jgi:hypothetical protein
MYHNCISYSSSNKGEENEEKNLNLEVGQKASNVGERERRLMNNNRMLMKKKLFKKRGTEILCMFGEGRD